MKKLLTLLICLMIITPVQAKKTYLIVINPGHQLNANLKKEPIGPHAKTYKYKVTGGTRGVSTKKREATVVLEIGKKLKTSLTKKGYKVIMTRTKMNVNLSNRERAEIANKKKADLMISLHCDGSSNRKQTGISVLPPNSKNPYLSKSIIQKDIKASKLILKEVGKTTKVKNKKISYRNDLSGVNWCKVPSVYLEMGFMTNPTEDKKLSSASYQNKLVKGIGNGIDQYFKK